MLSGSRIARQCLLRPKFARLRTSFGHGDGGPNAEILEMLRRNELAETSKPMAERNHFKARAFAEAIQIIGNLEYAITSAKDAKRLRGVGDGIAQRIGDLLQPPVSETAVLPEPPKRPTPPPPPEEEIEINVSAVRELAKVPRIGPNKAKQLVKEGCVSVPMLLEPKYFAMLSPAQQTSVTFYEELQQMASQSDAEAVIDFLKRNLSVQYEIVLAGGLRRGEAQSTDIYLALFHPSHIHVPLPAAPAIDSPDMQKPLLDRRGRQPQPFQDKSTHRPSKTSLLALDVIPTLTARGLVASTLAIGNKKWQGVVRIPESTPESARDQVDAREGRLAAIKKREGNFRRVDISLVPMRSRGSGLLALTGDANFFRHLRNKAHKLGLYLNEYGLWKWNPRATRTAKKSPGRPKNVVDGSTPVAKTAPSGAGFWELLELSTEEEIMTELGMDFLPPRRRNFNYIVNT